MGKQQEDILTSDRDAWDKEDNEPSLWYDRFTKYRLLGPSRSLRKLWRVVRFEQGQDDIKKNQGAPHLWNEKAKIWRWKERAEAWDEYERERREDEAEEILQTGLALAHIRVMKLQKLAEKIEDNLLKSGTRMSPYVVEQYRGILDDIAKEKGERAKETRIAGFNGGPIVIETAWGRGGSASIAWDKNEQPLLTTTVTEEASPIETQQEGQK